MISLRLCWIRRRGGKNPCRAPKGRREKKVSVKRPVHHGHLNFSGRGNRGGGWITRVVAVEFHNDKGGRFGVLLKRAEGGSPAGPDILRDPAASVKKIRLGGKKWNTERGPSIQPVKCSLRDKPKWFERGGRLYDY